MIQLFGYKKCSTCRKAEQFLTKKDVSYQFVDITVDPPTNTQLRKVMTLSQKPIRKLFNTSGQLYREMGLKSKLDSMSDNEMLALLEKHGKLIKRPIVLSPSKATVGFREDEFLEVWSF